MKTVRTIFLLIMLQSCFPSFTPKEKIKKELQQNGISLKWVDVIGTLDQDFPDYITIQRGEKTDTICQSHNIADLRMNKDIIIIGFYGTPKNYSDSINIREEVLGYKIAIDTTFIRDK